MARNKQSEQKQQKQQKQQRHKTDMSKIMAPVKDQINYAMFLSVLAVSTSLVALLILAFVLKHAIEKQTAYLIFELIIGAVLIILSIYLRHQAFNQSHFAAFKLETIIRSKLSQILSHLPLGYTISHGSGYFDKIIKDDVKELHSYVADSTPLIAQAYFSPILCALILLCFDWRLALIAIVVLVLGLLILSLVMKGADKLSYEYNTKQEEIVNLSLEFMDLMPVIRTFDSASTSYTYYNNALEDNRLFLKKWYQIQGVPARLSMMVLSALPTFLVLIWAGFFFFYHQSLSFTTWVAILILGTGMAEAFMPYISLYHINIKAQISAQRILELQNVPILKESLHPQIPQDSTISYENVSFTYEGREEKAINDVSFQLATGSFVALVGASGSGKSTITNLLARFWDVQEGKINIGGVNVKDISTEELMNNISLVFQDNHLFSGTIAENIALGMENASEEAIIEAAKMAQIDDFICTLPKGYHTAVQEEGVNFSVGQKQRLTIARAILQDRPILILDEAISANDAVHEAAFIQAIQSIIGHKTVLMMAHRLNSVVNADKILVFDHGQLVQEGKHQDLVAKPGRYFELWSAYKEASEWRIER